VTGLRPILLAAALLGALLAPFHFYPVFLSQILCFALFASAFNLLFGYAGMLSFGHAALFGSGAYAAALLVRDAGAPALGAVVAGALVGAVMGALMGALAIRRRGVYLAMITLAFAEVVYFIALQVPFTGGEDGMQGVPSGDLFGIVDLENPVAMYYFVLAIYLGGLAFLHRVVHSPYGRVLQAIRDNEARALSLGYRVSRYKLLAFVLSGAVAGVAGATKTLAFHFAALGDVYWHTSGEAILMTLLGGAGTLIGPTVGAALVVTLADSLAFLGEWVNFIKGAIFVVCVLLFRHGLVGELLDVSGRRIAWVRGSWNPLARTPPREEESR
jgi:branched-chain amino acid transport system permease protein